MKIKTKHVWVVIAVREQGYTREDEFAEEHVPIIVLRHKPSKQEETALLDAFLVKKSLDEGGPFDDPEDQAAFKEDWSVIVAKLDFQL